MSIINGKYCKVDFGNFKNLSTKAESVKGYFDKKYPDMIGLLKPSYGYLKCVDIRFVYEDKCAYKNGAIDVNPEEYLVEGNWGCLVHEGTHAVQNYPGKIEKSDPCWWLMEGIADYVRVLVANDVKPIKGNHENGYLEAAHFLFWLAKKYNDKIIITINQLVHDRIDKRNDMDFIFKTTIGKSYRDLTDEYNEED